MPVLAAIQELVTNGHLTQAQAENLTGAASYALEDPEVRELITTGALTPAHI